MGWFPIGYSTTFNEKSLIARLVPAGGAELEIIYLVILTIKSGVTKFIQVTVVSPRACNGCPDISAMKLCLSASRPGVLPVWGFG